jgi:hypothetical protein
MKTEPIRTLLLPIALVAFAAAGQAFLAGADTRAIITAALGALIVAAQELGRSLVTPVAPSKAARAPRHRSGEAGGVLLGVLLALGLAAVVYFVAVALGLPWVICLIAGLLGLFAGWVLGSRQPSP